jgi:capsid assembly protease
MKLLDVLTAPWAIEPAKLLEIQAIYATHLRGEKIDIGALEAKLGRPLANEPAPYQVQDGVAILQVGGVMAKKMNLFSQISGGCSTQLAARDLIQAAQDPSVHSIIQVFDTPGGTVDGTQAFADIISNVGQSKPVIALADGCCASAGIWAASAASQIFIAETTTTVGSIGVVAQHVDLSGADAQAGIKRTEVFAGKFKRIASDTGPLSKAGLQSIQDQVDYTYGLFVQAIAKNRGVSVDTVLQDMADGRLFIGEQAISAGLVDGVSTLDALIVKLNQDRTRSTSTRASAKPRPAAAGVANAAQPTPIPVSKGKDMPSTREQLAAESPELLSSLLAEGADQERTRIQAVEGQLIRGHEALIQTLKFDGKSTAGDAAMAVLAAERNTRNAAAQALASDAPAAIALKPIASVEKTALTRADIDTAAKAHMAANPGTDYIAAVKHVQAQHAQA